MRQGLEIEKWATDMPDIAKEQLRRTVPLLQVNSMSETLAYYVDVLGFSVDFCWPAKGPAKWAMVSRAEVSFMFTIDLGTSSSGFIAEKGNGVVLYVMVDDVEALYSELVERGRREWLRDRLQRGIRVEGRWACLGLPRLHK